MADKKAVVMFRCSPAQKRMVKIVAARYYTTTKNLLLGLVQELDREQEDKKQGFGFSGNDYFNHD